MIDFDRINKPRVEKILSILDMIDKSAASQGVPHDVYEDLLEPLHIRLYGIADKLISRN